MLQGKKIILVVTASIAAYKAALLVRLLVKQKAEVKVLMSKEAQKFITPLTLSTLSKNPVLTEFEKDETGEWNNHVSLALWADLILIAPASANTIAKCAHGICDNLVLATYLSAKCPVFFAPAMDLDMYKHPSTIHNLALLHSYGNQIIPSEKGELASGLVGEGRMAEPENILLHLEQFFKVNSNLHGKRVLITAGPTYEALDPVRFIGNYSTGKMGYAIAESMAKAGAEVHLISGPTHLNVQHPHIQLQRVTSAEEMYQAVLLLFPDSNLIILSAAVADYRPKEKAAQKIKKKEDEFSLELVKNTDIAHSLGQLKKEGQLMVGFALETQNEQQNAKEKLMKKNLDMIILNSLNDPGAGFGHDTNKVTILQKDREAIELPLLPKNEIADYLTQMLSAKMIH